MTLNAKGLIPPVGIGSALWWGVANVAEHKIQHGQVKNLSSGAGRLLAGLARSAPVANVVYGGLNALGAFANGYAWRGLAFSLYGAASAVAAPFVMRDTALSIQLRKAIQAKLPAQIQALSQQGAPLRKITAFVNNTVPIGLLLGLFCVTKVAQSRPDVQLLHTHGQSMQDMMAGGEGAPPLPQVLKQNFATEWRSFIDTLKNTPTLLAKGLGDIRQGVQNVFNPPPEMVNKSPWGRFSDTITQGSLVPLLYAYASAGRVVAALSAVALGVAGAGALVKHSFYQVEKQAVTPLARRLSQVMNLSLMAGQLAAALSPIFTRFNDWPDTMSSFYKVSALPYGASAFCALFNRSLLGFDKTALAKIGAFIQGTAYFGNLLSQGQQDAAEKKV